MREMILSEYFLMLSCFVSGFVVGVSMLGFGDRKHLSAKALKADELDECDEPIDHSCEHPNSSTLLLGLGNDRIVICHSCGEVT